MYEDEWQEPKPLEETLREVNFLLTQRPHSYDLRELKYKLEQQLTEGGSADGLEFAARSAKRRRNKREKHQRFAGETYFLPRGGWLATSTAHEAGEDAEEIRLKPEARVLREGAVEYDELPTDAPMSELREVAAEHGYDAVRIGTRLLVTNDEAIAHRQPTRPKKSWARGAA